MWYTIPTLCSFDEHMDLLFVPLSQPELLSFDPKSLFSDLEPLFSDPELLFNDPETIP